MNIICKTTYLLAKFLLIVPVGILSMMIMFGIAPIAFIFLCAVEFGNWSEIKRDLRTWYVTFPKDFIYYIIHDN